METLNKLAGVQDPDPAASFPPPPPIPESAHDIESQTAHSLASRPSRSSLPVNRRPSRRTLKEQSSQHSLRQPNGTDPPFTASRHSADSAGHETEGEIQWGPQHPCFPHPNPHVPLDSAEYQDTRVIRVQRDWLVAGDLYPALQNIYPEILLGYISEDEFRHVIESTNKMLKEAFNPWTVSNALDAVLGIATGFLWDNTGMTATKKKVAKLERWFDEWNRDAQAHGKEVRLIDPRRTGFTSLDIQIPDPLIDEPVLLETESRPPASIRT